MMVGLFKDFDYGWMASLQALFYCKKVAKQLRKELLLKLYDEYNIVAVIGHSHGCEIIAHASDLMRDDELPQKKPKMKACLINPALESDRRLLNLQKNGTTIYSCGDSNPANTNWNVTCTFTTAMQLAANDTLKVELG